jgi:hypothetical protein
VWFGGASLRRAVALVAAAVAGIAAVTALAAAPSATAATCAQRVISDWRDGRITGAYSPACLRAALRNLPEDLRVYGSAEEDITRALTRAVKPAAHRVLAATATRTNAARPRPAAKPARKAPRSLAGRKTPTVAVPAPAIAAAAAKDTGDRALAPARAAVAAGVLGLLALVLAATLWRRRRRHVGGSL